MEVVMEWKDEYSVGLAEIDRQHKQLIGLFGHIEEALDTDTNWLDLHSKIVELRNFASFHFEFEEALMRMFAFPKGEGHSQAHQLFFIRLDEIERCVVVDEGVKHDMIRFLFDWLFEHILKTDRELVEYILAGAVPVRA